MGNGKRSTAIAIGLAVVLALIGLRPPGAESTPAAEVQPQIARSGLFEFYSEIFINMHHALYRWGMAGPGADLSNLSPEVRVQAEDLALYRSLADWQRRIWDPPVAFYRLLMIDRDLVFDGNMRTLRDCLAERGSVCDRLADQDADALKLLITYMPRYRQLFWARHDLVNRAWIAEQLPLLERFENDLAERLATAYKGIWPPARSRVDVSFYANEVGGYTTGDGHIVVSSNEIGNQGYMGLELLFHEASHGATLEAPLRAMIERSFESLAAPESQEPAVGTGRGDGAQPEAPPDLWHLVIFYTAGHVTREVLAEADIDYAQTFAEFSGLWQSSAENIRAKTALDAHWKPALEAADGFEAAMAGVAGTLLASGGH